MSLKEIRKTIDRIDYNILKLLNQRMEYVLRLKKLKGEITDTEREFQVFEHIRKHSQNLIQPEFSIKLFKEIIAESKKLQGLDILVIGFQGEHGAYSSEAAINYNPEFIPIPCTDFIDVFNGIKNDQLDYGIVPIENSLEGAVVQVNDLLIKEDLKIIGETTIPIHHHLLTLPDTDYRDLHVVYSHPQALAQCHGFISRNKLEARPFYDTAGSAKMLAKEKLKNTGVIASHLCAELYNLSIIKENIEDFESNATRFVILSNNECKGKGDKCSIVFSAKHEAGSLFNSLKLFTDASINLTRIESRPVRGEPGRYNFLLDFQGSVNDPKIENVLDMIKGQCIFYKFLGCYPEFKR